MILYSRVKMMMMRRGIEVAEASVKLRERIDGIFCGIIRIVLLP